MGATASLLHILLCSAFYLHLSFSSPSPLPIGAHPLDEKYYQSDLIKCKDGHKSFSRDHINDNFCDCLDGTDEPGTSACPAGKFYCRNLGSKPQFLFSSRVNDHICDCCDGSDEYDGTVLCPNTCVMGGNIEYLSIRYDSPNRRQGSVGAEGAKLGLNAKDSVDKLRGLKLLIILQVVLVAIIVAYRIFRQRGRSRRRRSH